MVGRSGDSKQNFFYGSPKLWCGLFISSLKKVVIFQSHTALPYHLSHGPCHEKTAFCICGDRAANQRLCFCYIDSTISLFQASSHLR